MKFSNLLIPAISGFFLAFIFSASFLHTTGYDRTEKKVDSVFSEMDNETSPGCAVSVMDKGEILYQNGYGMANLEYGVPITPHSIFHVASVSKQFTAMAIQLLVEQGKVSWDDDVRDYVPEVPDFGSTITLDHLVHHVSGLRDQWSLLSMAGWRWESDVVRQKDVLEITSRQKALNFEPGARYLYSNTGFTLLTTVVERITDMTLREFTSEHIFKPLGMDNTHFQDDHRRIVPNRAWAYEPHEEGEFGFRNSIPVFDVVGASSLFTTVNDLAKWDQNFYNGTVGGQNVTTKMEKPFGLHNGETISYRHGLIYGSYKGLQTVGHGGADAGYRSQFLRFPDQEFTVAVLCNFPSSNPGGLASQVADIYLEKEFAEPQNETGKADSETEVTAEINDVDLQSMAGIYVTQPGDRTITLNFKNGTLFIEFGRSVPLQQVSETRFEIPGSEIELEIQMNPEIDDFELFYPGDNNSDRYTRMDGWSPSSDELLEYTGRYYSNELGTYYNYTLEEDELMFHHRKLDSFGLSPIFKDAFRSRGRIVVFTRDEEGSIDGFRISDGRVWGVRFEVME